MTSFVMSNNITFFLEITRDFLAGPAITLSVASSISLMSIFFYLHVQQLKMLHLISSSKSAPEKPGVRCEIAFKSTVSSSGLF